MNSKTNQLWHSDKQDGHVITFKLCAAGRGSGTGLGRLCGAGDVLAQSQCHCPLVGFNAETEGYTGRSTSVKIGDYNSTL